MVGAPAVGTSSMRTLPAVSWLRHEMLSVWVAGAVSYSRKDLEGVATRGERLDISVLGACGFASDIPAELVDHVVARFRCRGPLSASPAVREVLKTKEAR